MGQGAVCAQMNTDCEIAWRTNDQTIQLVLGNGNENEVPDTVRNVEPTQEKPTASMASRAFLPRGPTAKKMFITMYMEYQLELNPIPPLCLQSDPLGDENSFHSAKHPRNEASSERLVVATSFLRRPLLLLETFHHP
mmetsp:Transcript_36429/g.79696  ORF Transcript_36429/g.79696 Transcript_36429/m.79696 type:complete len:137 (+) Transcript_36429:2841-3251(+)